MEDLQLSEKEIELVTATRTREENRKKCAEEIQEILEKYSLRLALDPQSLLSDPKIILG